MGRVKHVDAFSMFSMEAELLGEFPEVCDGSHGLPEVCSALVTFCTSL